MVCMLQDSFQECPNYALSGSVALRRPLVGPCCSLMVPCRALAGILLGPCWALAGPLLGPCRPLVGEHSFHNLSTQHSFLLVPSRKNGFCPAPEPFHNLSTPPRWGPTNGPQAARKDPASAQQAPNKRPTRARQEPPKASNTFQDTIRCPNQGVHRLKGHNGGQTAPTACIREPTVFESNLCAPTNPTGQSYKALGVAVWPWAGKSAIIW